MIGKHLRTALLAACATPFLAGSADAQEFHLGLHKHFGSKSSISIGYSSGNSYGSTYGGHKHSGIHVGYNRRPRRIAPICPQPRTWIPGHYDTVVKKVWVPGHTDRVWIPPKYGTQYDNCGVPHKVLISAGYWKTIQHPGHYVTRHERIWVPGHYA